MAAIQSGGRADGVMVTGSGPDLARAIGAVLGEVVTIAQPDSENTLIGTQAISIRAEGATSAEVVGTLIDRVLDQLDDLSWTITDVSIDGVLKSDAGLSGWGYLRGLPLSREVSIAVAVASVETSDTEQSPVRIDVGLSVEKHP